MNKIYGDDATIKKARAAKPGDKTVLINWDAIAELPDQYEVIVSDVKFDVSKDFSDVGNGNYMPSPDLCYKIAEAKGIKGLEGRTEAIYEDVDISEMTMVDVPVFQKMLVGYRSVKQSTVMEEDGTERPSSVCQIDYNVWNRVTEIWAKEEQYTEGYTKKGKYPNKYDTRYKRKSHFKSELKFAMQKAETKAHIKTIRELAGLMTGYRMDDLKHGHMIFAKVRRSREILQAESAARLTAIAAGHKDNEPIDLLFGDQKTLLEPATQELKEDIIEHEAQPFEDYKSPKEKLVNAIETYNQGRQIPEELMGTAESMLGWLDKESDPEKTKHWDKAIGNLKKIEEEIPEDFRIKHGLY